MLHAESLRLRIYTLTRVISLLAASALSLAFADITHKTLAQYVHTTWTSEQGLPQNSVQAIIQTADGFLWMGTEEGLVRFDGVQFTVFSKANTPAFKHNDVKALCQTHDGAVWAGTAGGGALVYAKGEFRHYGVREGLSNDFVNAIVEDKNGVIWLGTDDGISAFQSGKFVHLESAAGLSGNTISALATGTDGVLWIGTNKGLKRIEPNGGIAGARARFGDLPHAANPLVGMPITALYTSPDGTLWAGTQNDGLFGLSRGGVVAYTSAHGLPHAPILSILEENNRTLWVGTGAGGVCLIHPETEHRFACDISSEISGVNTVLALYQDRERNIWMGTESGGLNRFRDGSLITYGPKQGIKGAVRSIFENPDHSLWVGTDLGLEHFKDGKATPYQTPYGSANNYAWAVMKDKDGNVWVGTNQGGLNEFTKGGIKNYTTRDGLPDNQVHAVYQDRRGRIWIGTERGGLAVLTDGRFHTYTSKDGLADNRVWCIQEDHSGDLWVGSDTGVTRMHDGQFNVIKTSNPAEPDPLVGSVIYIYEDADHVLWIGTYGGGLKRLKDGKLTTYNKSNGLFDDTVWNILEDRHRRLWMSSNFGIFRAERQELNDYAAGKIARVHSVSYGTSDGMPVAECNGGSQNSGWKAADGTLFFACVHGIVAVNPDRLRSNPLPPPVVIEQVLINGVQRGDRATIPVGKGELEFHFAGLSYVAPEKVTFRYKLEGFDNNWINAGHRRDAYYTNIPAGHYRFRVIAANNDGVWNNGGASFAFQLQPRFFQTLWFYLLSAVFVLTFAGASYVWRIRQLRKREDELERQVAERTAALEKEISGHHQTEEELQQEIVERKRATERAEAATQAKSEFLANMSHEIRTPLNGVMGMLELVAGTGLSADQNELLSMAHHSATALLAVINDILDFSKIEAGKLYFESEPFDLAETVVNACRTVGVKAHAKGLELICSVAPAVPNRLIGDSARLRQILLNLLGNAIKFTETGEIVLQVELESARDSEMQLAFSVADTGIGIPKEKQDSIFQAFSQADTSITRRFGGTGLGLTICARIVELMGGRIWLSSEPGKGSTFHFTARFAAPDARQHTDNVNADLGKMRVLLVEDNLSRRQLVQRMLCDFGAETVTAGTAGEAIEVLKASLKKNLRFETLLIDCRLPEMNGTELYQILKSEQEAVDSRRGFHTVMMLDCDRYTALAAECREMGISYIMKPFSRSELLETLRSGASPVRANAGSLAGTHSESGRRLRILLAEDNVINQKVAIKMLEGLGHSVTVAQNGVQAVACVKEHAFDLIFMDLHMPEMDGFAATAIIREWQRLRGERVSIIAMTASAMSGDRERCLEAQMDGYISKPFTSASLEATIRNHLVSPDFALQPA